MLMDISGLLVEHMHKPARTSFGRPIDAPRKPWNSTSIWSFLRWMAPMRRKLQLCSQLTKLGLSRIYSWLGRVVTREASFQVALPSSLGYDAAAHISCARQHPMGCRRLLAHCDKELSELTKMVKRVVAIDRHWFLISQPCEAHMACSRNNLRRTYAIVRQLSVAPLKAPKVVRMEDGPFSSTRSLATATLVRPPSGRCPGAAGSAAAGH